MISLLRDKFQQKALFHIIHEDDIYLLNTEEAERFQVYNTSYLGRNILDMQRSIIMHCMNLIGSRLASGKEADMKGKKRSSRKKRRGGDCFFLG